LKGHDVADQEAAGTGQGGTPGRASMGSDVPQSMVSRIVAGLRYAVSGVGPENWFGPWQPLPPQAQERTEGRAFDFPVGYNLRIQPREGEPYGFGTLRALADGYDLLRLVLETRKDQIESYEWEIVPKRHGDDASKYKEDIRRVTEFLEYPDKEHNWAQWLRLQVEDLLVIDAVAVYPRANRAGSLYGFELIDAGTLKRVIDDDGRTPLPPSPAYQQVLKGIPASNYTRDQIVYAMRNPRTNRIYGYSPVEQVVMTVNIAMRRQLSQLDFYTQGNIPEAIAQTPETWSSKTIQEFQLWWDSALEGNNAARRKMKFIPKLDGIVFPKDAILKDQYDEWLARIICFAFSITPSALMQQVNRASGEQMADTAKEEGLMPLLRFLNAHFSLLIQKYLGVPHLKFQFKVVNKVDPKTQADIHGIYVDKKVLTPDEVREDLGRPAMTEEQKASVAPPPPPGIDPETGEPLPTGQPGAVVGSDGKPLVGAAALAAKAKEAAPKPEGDGPPPDLGKAWQPEVHVHMAPITVNTPAVEVTAGDTFVTVPPAPAQVVKVYEGHRIEARPQLEKRITAGRDPATGQLVGRVEVLGDQDEAARILAKAMGRRDGE
jgi:Phage portal protein